MNFFQRFSAPFSLIPGCRRDARSWRQGFCQSAWFPGTRFSEEHEIRTANGIEKGDLVTFSGGSSFCGMYGYAKICRHPIREEISFEVKIVGYRMYHITSFVRKAENVTPMEIREANEKGLNRLMGIGYFAEGEIVAEDHEDYEDD